MLPVQETMEWLLQQLMPTVDMAKKKLSIGDKNAELFYIRTVVDGDRLQLNIVKPFFEMESEEHFKAYIQSLPDELEITSREQVLLELSKGSVIVIIQDQMILIDLKKVHTQDLMQTITENTIQGSQLALSEDVHTNINLIRQRYHQPSLSVEMLDIGTRSHQALAIIYDRDHVNEDVLDRVKRKLEKIDAPIVQSSLDLLRYMNDKKYSLFPTMIVTERADRIIYNLSGGKVILVLDGDPNSLIAPCVFFDLMSAMDDAYNLYWVSRFFKSLRYLALILTLVVPGFYVATISHNPELLRVQLALTVAGSRTGIPYPSFVEVLFMLLFMELLVEASIRLPRAVSAAATTVGGLILGTAVTEAALASNVMIIVVSAVAICNFVIPINDLSNAVRILKYVVVIFATFAGVMGIALAGLGIIMYIVSLRSFGQPYLRLFYKKKQDELEGG